VNIWFDLVKGNSSGMFGINDEGLKAFKIKLLTKNEAP